MQCKKEHLHHNPRPDGFIPVHGECLRKGRKDKGSRGIGTEQSQLACKPQGTENDT